MASSVLGVSVRPWHDLDEEELLCHYEKPDGYEKVGFMVQKGIITRIDIWGPTYFTDKGVTVGQQEIRIFEEYGKDEMVEVKPDIYQKRITERIHPYIGKEGKYIIVHYSDGYRMIFETDNGLITRFRTGKSPSVDYIEGCS
jgi:hypothetical protein